MSYKSFIPFFEFACKFMNTFKNYDTWLLKEKIALTSFYNFSVTCIKNICSYCLMRTAVEELLAQ